MTIPVVIDTDPGIDDAAAISILASDPRINIRLIATVTGNVGIGHTTTNALKLLTFLQKRIPVVRGCAQPLMRDNHFATEAHGASGMGGFNFPDPDMTLLLDGNVVVEEYRAIVESEEPVTLITLGPLTNIALLLSAFPDVKNNIREIVMMGGSTARGNIGVYSEFNVFIDPEAAKIVFRSGVPITMVGLDIGRKALLTVEDLEVMEASGEIGEMIGSLFRSYDGGHIENGIKMYDPSAAMFVLEPDLFEVQEAFVDVEISSDLTLGATVVDFDGPSSERTNARVCVDVNVSRFRQNYVKRICDARPQ